jgi:hypothetical protein
MYYPGGQLKLGGLADVSGMKIMGAIGGGVLGVVISSVVIGALPRKMQDIGMLTAAGVVPALAIAGWFLFKEGYDFEFSEEEIYEDS